MAINQLIILLCLIATTKEISKFKTGNGFNSQMAIQQIEQSDAIHFRKIGQIIGDVHFGHIKLDINYKLSKSLLTETCNKLRGLHTDGDRGKKYGTEPKLSKKCYEVLAQLSQISRVFDGHVTRFQTSSQGDGHENEKHRQPRQVFLATAGAAIIGGIIGWITSKIWGAPKPDPELTHHVNTLHQMSWLDHQTVITAVQSVTNLARDMKTFSYYSDNLYRYLEIFIALSRLSDQTTNFMTGLNDLLHGRLSPNIMSPEALKVALQKLNSKLETKSLILAIENEHQAYNYPISYQQFKNLTIQIHLHIPALRQHDVLDLYKFMPLPLIIHSSHGPAYAMPKPEHQYLAINSDQSQYRVMPAADLANECSHIGELFICRHSNLVAKKSRPNCLVALFTNDHGNIPTLCNFDFKPQLDELVQLGESSFLLFQSEASPISFYCDPGTKNPPISAKAGVQQIYVAPGCIAESRSFLFEAQVTINSAANDIVPIHFTPVNVSKFTSYTTHDIAKVIHDLDLTKLQSIQSFKQLDALYGQKVLHQQLGYSIGPTLGIIIIIFGVLFTYWYCKKNRIVPPIQQDPLQIPLGQIPPPNNAPPPVYPCVGNCPK
jgi:hypothetical protein